MFFIFFALKKVFITPESYVLGMYSDFTSPTLFAFEVVILVWSLFHVKHIVSRETLFLKRYLFHVLVIGLIVALGFYLSPDRNYLLFFKGMFHVLILRLLYWQFKMFHVKHSVRFTLAIFVILSCIVSLIAISQFHVKHSLGLKYLGEPTLQLGQSGIANVSRETFKWLRPYGTQSHPNILSMFLGSTLIVLVYNVSRETFSRRLLYSVVILPIGMAFFLAYSRSSILALILSLVICFTVFHRNMDKKSTLLNAGYLAFAGLLLTLYMKPWLDLRNSLHDQSVTLRLSYLEQLFHVKHFQYIFGQGFGQGLLSVKHFEMFHSAWMIQPIHNFFGIMAFELGFVLTIWLIVWLIIKMFHVARHVKHFVKQSVKQFEFPMIFSLGIFFLIVSQLDHYFYTNPPAMAVLVYFINVSQDIYNKTLNKLSVSRKL